MQMISLHDRTAQQNHERNRNTVETIAQNLYRLILFTGILPTPNFQYTN